jgi:predicted ribosome quality control (RQC) complex YloA/Tae2 family protein
VNEKTLQAVTAELETVLPGKRFGRVIPLSKRSFVADLRLAESRYLFIAAEPGEPRMYFIRRRLKDLERLAEPPQSFHLLLRKRLSSSEVVSVQKLSDERVVFIHFGGNDEAGEPAVSTLAVQLTGKSANVFLLNEAGQIVSSLVDRDSDGQRLGDHYSRPSRPLSATRPIDGAFDIKPIDGSISDALDEFYLKRESDKRFQSKVENARRTLNRELSKRRTLIGRLRADVAGHGDAEQWKRYGDLILANLSSAERKDDRIVVTDYYDDETPKIEIEVDPNLSLTDAANKYFRLYNKAQNAAVEVERRIETVEREVQALESKRNELEKAVAERDESYFADEPKGKPSKRERQNKQRSTGTREFMSSDGFQILVGKRATDNDQLTFRIAGPVDLWLHAADYSGSHVVVRNPNRKEIPQRTLLEAARLAAFYSSGKSQPKAAVHYTQKKFVNKPKGAAPGLVRLASFKTILVEPSIPEALDQKSRI